MFIRKKDYQDLKRKEQMLLWMTKYHHQRYETPDWLVISCSFYNQETDKVSFHTTIFKWTRKYKFIPLRDANNKIRKAQVKDWKKLTNIISYELPDLKKCLHEYQQNTIGKMIENCSCRKVENNGKTKK